MGRKERAEKTGQTGRLTQGQFEAMIFAGITVRRRSHENIFTDDAPSTHRGAYADWVKRGGLDEMESAELSRKQAERLKAIAPSSRYAQLRDDLTSLQDGHSLVIQVGSTNRFLPLHEYLEKIELRMYEVTAYPSDRGGWGHSSGTVTLRVWMKDGDTATIYATDCVEKHFSVRTGDLLGGPGSMHSESTYGNRTVRVSQELLGGAHLAVVSTSGLARTWRDIFGG